jgi:toxin YoeB
MTAGPATGPAERLAVLERGFLSDLTFWIGSDPRTALRVMALIDAVLRDPFRGIGKPEPLRHASHGHWSRRVTSGDRMVYRVSGAHVLFVFARGHYPG